MRLWYEEISLNILCDGKVVFSQCVSCDMCLTSSHLSRHCCWIGRIKWLKIITPWFPRHLSAMSHVNYQKASNPTRSFLPSLMCPDYVYFVIFFGDFCAPTMGNFTQMFFSFWSAFKWSENPLSPRFILKKINLEQTLCTAWCTTAERRCGTTAGSYDNSLQWLWLAPLDVGRTRLGEFRG